MIQADSVHSTPPINTSATDDDLHTPERLQDALYRRTDIAPETFFQALGRVRRAARDEIERLIAWLDSTIDVDEDTAADDEPCDDQELEPSLGSFDRMSDQIKAWQGGNYDVDAELDKCDDEPSLGSVGEQHIYQRAGPAAVAGTSRSTTAIPASPAWRESVRRSVRETGRTR